MKRILALLITVALFICCLSVFVYADNRNLTVYIASGSSTAYRYHATASCSSLSRSTVASVTLETAAKRGYTPCLRCKPPEPDFDVNATPRPNTSGSTSSPSFSTGRKSLGISPSSNSSSGGGNGAFMVVPILLLIGYAVFGKSNPKKHTQSVHPSNSASPTYREITSASPGWSQTTASSHPATATITRSTAATTAEALPFSDSTVITYKPGMHLFFWDHRLGKVGELVVLSVLENGFSFMYNGKTQFSPYSAASGKMYKSALAVPKPSTYPDNSYSSDKAKKFGSLLLYRVNSSNIARVGYDYSSSTLAVEFIGSGLYIYHDVPATVFSSLLEAPSKGKFLISNVIGKYDYERLS